MPVKEWGLVSNGKYIRKTALLWELTIQSTSGLAKNPDFYDTSSHSDSYREGGNEQKFVFWACIFELIFVYYILIPMIKK